MIGRFFWKINVTISFFRNYTGPTSGSGDERRSRNYGSRGQYSPVIEIDEDSHSKFITESGVRASVGPGTGSGRGGGVQPEEPEEIEYKLDRYCQPRNSLLSLISDFVVNCSAKLTEINKKERQEKSMELLDNKCYMKLVDIAHSLLKMAPYDQVRSYISSFISILSENWFSKFSRQKV